MPLPKVERRSVSASLRAVTGSAFEIAGLAVAYGVHSQDLGGFRERIMPGSFTRSLQSKTDVKALFNHDQNVVLGRSANGTLSLQDAADGLRFVVKLNPDSQQHRDIHASVKRGDISECSFAFALDGDDGATYDDAPESELVNDEAYGDAKNDEAGSDAKNDEAGTRSAKRGTFKRRTVKRAKLFDVSAVTYPAYDRGTAVSARSASYSISRRLAAAPLNVSIAQHDAAMRAKANRQAFEINRSAPGLRIPFGTTNVVPMTIDEIANPFGWGKDEVFIFDPDIRARVKAVFQELQIKRGFAREAEREADRQLIADCKREFGIV
ncbi:MAG: HK97 family phage prohead protease [Terriglobales bacterium]